MSEEQLTRIETRLDSVQAELVDLRRDTADLRRDTADFRRDTEDKFRAMARLIDERFRDAANQARQEYDGISEAIGEVRMAALAGDEALRRDNAAGFVALRHELSDGLASLRRETQGGQKPDIAAGLASVQSETAGLRRSVDRIDDKLDRVLAKRPAVSPRRRDR